MTTSNSPIQVLLTLKDRQERTAFQSYMRALQRVEQIQEQISSVDWELDHLEQGWHIQLAQGCSMEMLQAAIQFHRERRLDLQRHLTHSRKAADAAFQQWIAAKQALELFDAHLQKQKRRHQQRESGNKQKKLDTIPARNLAVRLARLEPKSLDMN